MNLEKLLNEKLQRKMKIDENLNKFSLIESKVERFDETISYLHTLSEEIGDEEKFKHTIEEQWETIKNLLGMGEKKVVRYQPDTAGDKVVKTVGGGATSQLTEYLISYLLEMIGFKGPLASAVATFFSEMGITDLIALAKGDEDCYKYGRKLAKAVTEALINYIIKTNVKKNTVGYDFLRNALFQYLYNEGYMNSLGKFICSKIQKNKFKFF